MKILTRPLPLLLLLAVLVATADCACSQTAAPAEQPPYARRNSFGILAAYSPNTSHGLLQVSYVFGR